MRPASMAAHLAAHRALARLPTSRAATAAGWCVAGALPLIGLASLLAHSELDPGWENPRVHFLLFLAVGGTASVLAFAAGEAARRRGDARVTLMSLAFLATGGFMALHALGTRTILLSGDYAGFKIAIPVGLLTASALAVAAAFVDVRPRFAGTVIRRRRFLQAAILMTMAVWVVWTLTRLPPLQRPSSEAAADSGLAAMAALGVAVYGVAAARFWLTFRGRMSLLPASVIACFVLLAEAMIGVATTGERKWHASWWEWHGLIVLAYLLVGLAALREWRDERFRPLYLETTRERRREVTVLFGDMAGFTTFSERSASPEVAGMLSAFYSVATPLISRRFGGVIERLTGDGMLVSFNAHADQPNHAALAAATGLALQREAEGLAGEHDGWPRLRVGINTGDVVIREMGGDGYVAYELCGDDVNIAARLQERAPVGGVLIGARTYRQLRRGAVVEARPGLRVKGKDVAVDAYLLQDLE